MSKNRILSIALLAAVMLISVWAINAAAVDPVRPSETLEVYIRADGADYLVYTYSLSEMKALARGKDVHYSHIDNMPATVLTIADGVYITDLLADVGIRAGLEVADFSRLRFDSTDGAMVNFYREDLFATRYYYPAMHEEGHGLNRDNEIIYDLGAGTRVEPMLAYYAWQNRVPMPSEYREEYYPECYTVLFGITPQEAKPNITPRVSEYKRGIYKMTVDLGSTAIALQELRLEQSAATIDIGEEITLSMTYLPTNIWQKDKEVVWSSSNSGVASVSANGVVKGVSAGTATITVTAKNNTSISANCKITVVAAQTSAVAVTGITLNWTEATILIDSQFLLKASVKPATASQSTVTWKSSNPSVATVDDNGLVHGLTIGQTTITATVGNISAACLITVSNEVIPATGIRLNPRTLTLEPQAVYQLQVIISPANATQNTVYWSSDAPGIVSVDTEGLLTARNSGVANITVTTEDGGFSDYCAVTVSKAGETVIYGAAFTDTEEHWAKEAIITMYELGFISGYNDGSFHPDATITRAEFLTILMRVLLMTRGIDLQTGYTFADSENHWAKDHISTAVFLGITSGYGNGLFGPNDSITREQIAVMLAKADSAEKNGYSVSFTDQTSIATWAISEVAYCVQKGYFTGYEDGSFGPKKNASRAEVATLLLRFYQNNI